ncbi:hypothetical protein HDU76_002097 [Blyttiomyces sp. JEL0837]|nr:hypothetical protein HDU76_002097 [Blyttiomyces sp. JEL0837]
MPNSDGLSVTCWLKQAPASPGQFVGYQSGGGVVQRANMDIPHYDAQNVTASNAAECGQLCAGNSQCAWATFIPSLGCYMKKPDTSNANMYMRFRQSVEPFLGNVPNYDIPNTYFVATSSSQCYLQCVNNPQCDWVNYDVTNAASIQIPCWLKVGPTFNGRSTVYAYRSTTL